MDRVFLEGIAVVLASGIVFVGSVVLLMAMVMGFRLAYFVGASVTLGFLLIMAVVWSFTQLGPVGELPTWRAVSGGERAAQLDFAPASEYPGEPWEAPDEDDEAEAAEGAELETAAATVLEDLITEGKVEGFESASDAIAEEGSTRFLEQDGGRFGMVTFVPAEGSNALGQAVVAMRFDPGNPLGQARAIAVGTALLLGGHLYGLNRAEKKAQRAAEPRAA